MSVRTKRQIYILIAIIILLGGLLLIFIPTKTTALAAIGTSLFAGGIIALLDYWYGSIVAVEREKADEILSSGIASTHPRRDLQEYHDLMGNLSSRVDISGYSLRNFHESFQDLIAHRLQRKKNLRIRILVVDPESEMSTRREQFEGHAQGTFKQSFENLIEHYAPFRNQVELRKLGIPLTTMVFRIDNVMFVGPQFVSAPSKATVTLELHHGKETWMFHEFEKEFESLWDAGEDV